MKKASKILIKTSVSLIVLGVIISSIFFCLGGSFNIENFNETVLNFNEIFDSISIQTNSTDVNIEKSANNKSYIICNESENIKYSLKNENGTLTVTENDLSEWYDFIGIYTAPRSITLYIPEETYNMLLVNTQSGAITSKDTEISFENVLLNTSSGDIKFENSVAEELSVTTQSGNAECANNSPEKIKIKSASGEIRIYTNHVNNAELSSTSGDILINRLYAGGNIDISSLSGDVYMANSKANTDLKIETSSGNIEFEKCDGGRVEIESASGKVSGSFLTNKNFKLKSNSGRINRPNKPSGVQDCFITTKSGNIDIWLEKQE